MSTSDKEKLKLRVRIPGATDPIELSVDHDVHINTLKYLIADQSKGALASESMRLLSGFPPKSIETLTVPEGKDPALASSYFRSGDMIIAQAGNAVGHVTRGEGTYLSGAGGGGTNGSVVSVSSAHELHKYTSDERTVTVIDFYATWCGPCRTVAPEIESLAKQYKHVNFVKVDVDALSDVAQSYGVRAMPTFKVVKGGREVGEVVGADVRKLQDIVKGAM